MPDKEQIIIDGVDVSGCEEILTGAFCHHLNNDCDKFPKCYFKQLARKTQEYTELKEDYKELEQRHNEAFQDFEKLKQECEELKTVNARLLNRLEVNDSDVGIVFKQELELQNKKNEFYIAIKNLNRYLKALEEIEKTITALHYIAIPFHKGITHELADIVQEYKNKILDIISKAKETK